jgi:hypothetical protein
MVALDGGVIETESDWPIERRLARLHEALGELIRWHEPKAMALEDLFFGRNVGSALSVGQARGVALFAAAQRPVACFDYTPQAVKKAVCRSGRPTRTRFSGWSPAWTAEAAAPTTPRTPSRRSATRERSSTRRGRHFGRPRVGTTPASPVSDGRVTTPHEDPERHPGLGPES